MPSARRKVLKGRTKRIQNYVVGDMRELCLLETHYGRCGSGDHAADGGALSAGVKTTDIPKNCFEVTIHRKRWGHVIDGAEAAT